MGLTLQNGVMLRVGTFSYLQVVIDRKRYFQKLRSRTELQAG